MFKRVAILGAGPAGLAAAHAAYLAGAWVHIFALGTKSELYGCQYLHAPLPYIEVEKRRVTYALMGTAEKYRERVYGDAWAGEVSPGDLEGDHDAWDIRAAYDQLWEMYGPASRGRSRFERVRIDARWMSVFLAEDGEKVIAGEWFTHIISTIPAPAICANPGHSFHSQEIYAIGDAPERGQFAPVGAPENHVICNGLGEEEDAPAWYRISNVFGMSTVEWPVSAKPPIPELSKVQKPLFTDCDCFPGVHRMGRYGAWKKDQLTHHVFEQTTELLK